MGWIRGLGRGERVVLIVALGVALEAFCSYFVPLETYPFTSSSQLNLIQSGPPGWFRVVVWLALIALWAICSIRILRAPPVE